MSPPEAQAVALAAPRLFRAPAARPVPVRRRLGPGPAIPFAGAIGPLLILAVWSLSSVAGWADPRLLPAPWRVVETAVQLIESGRLQDNLAISALRAAIGLSLGVVIGTVLALIAGLNRLGDAVIDGPVQIKRAIPNLALVPLLMLWLGIDEVMKITIITLAVVAPIYVHTHNGLRAIDQRYVELAQSLDLSQWRFIRDVVLPGALPGFLLGLRFAMTSAWLSLVVVEQINAVSGIGYMIDLARSHGQTRIILVGIAVYAILGLVSDLGVRLLQKRVLRWRRSLAE
ncbi:ABC transporter permease [Humitalea sp. 24SJ18S-53]|uniref:ABC transporter permease n=1 Tax=Humitalea sp. 24SJ18S-53 TaxID=3422307 RepID=UPI003D67B949